MSSFEKNFKDVVARIVRKETAQLRAEVAALRGELKLLQKDHAGYCKMDAASWRDQYEFNENIVDALSDAWKTLEEEGVVKPVAVVEEDKAPAKAKAAGKPAALDAAGIRAIREKTGLNKSQFAKLLGITASMYSQWESGKVKPRRTGAQKLATVTAMGKRELARACKEAGIARRAPKAKKPVPTDVKK